MRQQEIVSSRKELLDDREGVPSNSMGNQEVCAVPVREDICCADRSSPVTVLPTPHPHETGAPLGPKKHLDLGHFKVFLFLEVALFPIMPVVLMKQLLDCLIYEALDLPRG